MTPQYEQMECSLNNIRIYIESKVHDKALGEILWMLDHLHKLLDEVRRREQG